MTKNGTPVIACQFTVQKKQTRESGYTKPNLDEVFYQATWYTVLWQTFRVRLSNRNDDKKRYDIIFSPVYGTKKSNEVIRAHQTHVI